MILQLLPHKRTYPKLVPREDTERRTETKELPRRKSPLPKITTKNEDQTMD